MATLAANGLSSILIPFLPHSPMIDGECEKFPIKATEKKEIITFTGEFDRKIRSLHTFTINPGNCTQSPVNVTKLYTFHHIHRITRGFFTITGDSSQSPDLVHLP